MGVFNRKDGAGFDAKSRKDLIFRISGGVISLIAALILLGSASSEDVRGIFAPFTDGPYSIFDQNREVRVENRARMYVSAERLISEIENLNVDERQYTQVDISADAEHGTKLDNSGDHDGSEQATFTPVKSKNAKNMEKGLDFNESLLPAQCLLDHQYGMQECGQIWWDNGAEEASIDGQALCRAYTIRQSLACEIDYCKERLAAWKRSLFTWGFVLLIIGGGLVGAGIPLGLVFVVVGAFAFGLSTAPLLDVIDFLNCR